MFASLLCYRNGSNTIHILVTNHYYIDSNISICQIIFSLGLSCSQWTNGDENRFRTLSNMNFQSEKIKVTSPMEKVTSSVKSLVWMISGNINSSHLTGYVIHFILDRAGLEMQCLIPGDQSQDKCQPGHFSAKQTLTAWQYLWVNSPSEPPFRWFLTFFAWKGDRWFFGGWPWVGLHKSQHFVFRSIAVMFLCVVGPQVQCLFMRWGGGYFHPMWPGDPRNWFGTTNLAE